jgi:hypothetical protein
VQGPVDDGEVDGHAGRLECRGECARLLDGDPLIDRMADEERRIGGVDPGDR